MNNQGNITPPKDTHRTSMTSPKEMENYELLKKLNEL